MTSRPLFIISTLIFFTLLLKIFANPIFSQVNLESGNYVLENPVIGDPLAGSSESTNFKQLVSSYPTDAFTSTSSNFQLNGGFTSLVQANVPSLICAETVTDSSDTDCTGIPGANGMVGVCSEPGCYDRAKFEIDNQDNAADARYALQISTSPTFASNVFYVDGSTRLLKSNLTISDFLPKCEWEGTVVSGVCITPVTSFQKYNILGLTPNTTYYVRLSAYSGTTSDTTFTQTMWSPSLNFTTTITTINFDINIAPNTNTETNAPYQLPLGNLVPNQVTSSPDYIVLKISTNSALGAESLLRSENNALRKDMSNQIVSASADLSSAPSGYGLRNHSTTNSADNVTELGGSIQVSNSPIDYTDTGAAQRVGEVASTYQRLFDTAGAAILNGISGFRTKAKVTSTTTSGNYSDILHFIVLSDI